MSLLGSYLFYSHAHSSFMCPFSRFSWKNLQGTASWKSIQIFKWYDDCSTSKVQLARCLLITEAGKMDKFKKSDCCYQKTRTSAFVPLHNCTCTTLQFSQKPRTSYVQPNVQPCDGNSDPLLVFQPITAQLCNLTAEKSCDRLKDENKFPRGELTTTTTTSLRLFHLYFSALVQLSEMAKDSREAIFIL